MNPETKVEALARLSEDIAKNISDAWVWPTHGAVKGFWGVGPIMLVGERPSTGNFGGPSDRLLYSLLEKHGACEAHLTDVIKSRGRVGDAYPSDLASHRHFFDRELEIVSPRVIIALGAKVYDLLQFGLAGSGIPIRHIWHYSYARRGRNKAALFENQIKDALGNITL